jgi:glucosylceramidase
MSFVKIKFRRKRKSSSCRARTGSIRILSARAALKMLRFKIPMGQSCSLVLNSGGNAGTFGVSFNGQSFNYTLPAGAVATFTWE